MGVYALYQELKTSPFHEEEVGSDYWRFAQTGTTGVQALWSTNRDLVDGYGIRTFTQYNTLSSAAFAQVDWEFFKNFRILPGIRFNFDQKYLNYLGQTHGGKETNDPDLIALKNSVYSNQQFKAKTTNQNISGNLTLSYKPTPKLNTFVTYATNYKPIGLNVGGLPTSNGQPDLSLVEVKPEFVQHMEAGIKTKPMRKAILNFAVFNTNLSDYQTLVQSPELGQGRGYLANAEKVIVKGFEVDGNYKLKKFLTVNASLAYTDGNYVKFINAPLPLEEVGKTIPNPNGTGTVQQNFKNISGGELPGISKINTSVGAEVSTAGKFLGKEGRFFLATDVYYRTGFSSNPTPSTVLRIESYGLINTRLGFRGENFAFFIWSRNLANTKYFEQLQAAPGNAGLYVGVLGDPRTFGITFRYTLD